MKSYRDLEVYRLAHELALSVHKMSLKLPQYELYEEGSQVRRSSKGVSSCIVEGYGRKRYKAEFVKFLVYAHASCDETINHLHFIKDAHTALAAEALDLIHSYEKLSSKINRLVRYVDKDWNKVVEPETCNV